MYPVCFVCYRVATVDDKLGLITGLLLMVWNWRLVLHTQGPWSALHATPHHAVRASTWAAAGGHQQAPAQHVRREAIAAHQVGVSKVFGFCIMQTWALAGDGGLICLWVGGLLLLAGDTISPVRLQPCDQPAKRPNHNQIFLVNIEVFSFVIFRRKKKIIPGCVFCCI